MTTARDIVTGALSELLMLDGASGPSAEDAALGLSVLNDMFAGWPADGVGISVPTLVLGSTFPLDARHVDGCKALLAVNLAPAFAVEPSPLTLTRASNGWKRLLAQYIVAPTSTAGTYVAESGLVWTPGRTAYHHGLGVQASEATANVGALEFIIGDGSITIPVGVQGYLAVPFDCTITGWALAADQAGSTTIDVWRCTQAQFDGGITHPVLADSITGGSPLIMVNAASAEASTVTGWGTTLAAGDWLAFPALTAQTITRLTVVLNVVRT